MSVALFLKTGPVFGSAAILYLFTILNTFIVQLEDLKDHIKGNFLIDRYNYAYPQPARAGNNKFDVGRK